MSSTRLTETSARYISISASSTKLSLPTVALDDRRLELLAQLRYLELDFARLRPELAPVAARPRVASGFGPLVTRGI
jgi:hypothetical protein